MKIIKKKVNSFRLSGFNVTKFDWWSLNSTVERPRGSMTFAVEKIKVLGGQSVQTVEVRAAANNQGILGQNERDKDGNMSTEAQLEDAECDNKYERTGERVG